MEGWGEDRRALESHSEEGHDFDKGFHGQKGPVRKQWFFRKWLFLDDSYRSFSTNHSTNFLIIFTSLTSSRVCLQPWEVSLVLEQPRICDRDMMLAHCFLISWLKTHVPYCMKCTSSKSQCHYLTMLAQLNHYQQARSIFAFGYEFLWFYISWIRYQILMNTCKKNKPIISHGIGSLWKTLLD